MTAKEYFKPVLFTDQHEAIEKEYNGIHDAIYKAMQEYAEHYHKEEMKTDLELLEVCQGMIAKFILFIPTGDTREKVTEFNIKLLAHIKEQKELI